jgi:hypothetical protein
MIIAGRFNGPPGSGNGGYSAGVFAGGSASEITLRLPPPLDTPLSIVDGQVRAPDSSVVAEVAPVDKLDTVVPPVGYADAVSASASGPCPTTVLCSPAPAPPGSPSPAEPVPAQQPVRTNGRRGPQWWV